MRSVAVGRRLLVVVLVVGAFGVAGPDAAYGRFADSHAGTGSFAAADKFQNNGGGGGGPTANAGGPYEVFEDSTVPLDGTKSSGKGNPGYSWRILSGPGSLSGTATSTPTYTAPADVGSDTRVTVELTVTNKEQTATDQTDITVKDAGSGNQVPIARFSGTRSGNSDNVDLDATASSDPEGASLTYDWDVDGDGTYELTDASPTTREKIPSGTAVTLRVTDDVGNTDTVTKTV